MFVNTSLNFQFLQIDFPPPSHLPILDALESDSQHGKRRPCRFLHCQARRAPGSRGCEGLSGSCFGV